MVILKVEDLDHGKWLVVIECNKGLSIYLNPFYVKIHLGGNMRRFIISDLHGDGNAYKSIMLYLERINQIEPVILYINGDLIDWGIESGEMFLDVKNRIINGPFKIIYLGGNHELMMLTHYLEQQSESLVSYDFWLESGGYDTKFGIEDVLDENQMPEVINFVSNLKMYHVFNEKINGKNIALAHASTTSINDEECNIRLKDNHPDTEQFLWARENALYAPFHYRIGNDRFFSIVGHTPNNNRFGFEYHPNDNFLSIDGGCIAYVKGNFEYNHVPLLEINNGYLKVMTFNHNNEITHGNYFIDNRVVPFSDEELDKERSFIDQSFKPKKLLKLPDNIIGYEDSIL